MDVLWSPWRYDYINSGERPGSNGCVFCSIVIDPASDEANHVLKRAGFNFVILNLYPYAAGHILIVPFEHVADLSKASKQTTDEMMDLMKAAQSVLSDVYRPEGFNMGINLGKSAGAGVADHLHSHVLPRWSGDVNFMTSIAETRNIPESLDTTYQKLAGKF